MEVSGFVVFLIVVIIILVCFLMGFMWDAAYYKGHATAYELMLIKAGLIKEAVLTKEDEEEEGPVE